MHNYFRGCLTIPISEILESLSFVVGWFCCFSAIVAYFLMFMAFFIVSSYLAELNWYLKEPGFIMHSSRKKNSVCFLPVSGALLNQDHLFNNSLLYSWLNTVEIWVPNLFENWSVVNNSKEILLFSLLLLFSI